MKKSTIIILVIILLYFVSCSTIVSYFTKDSIPQGNVAVIPITGVISLSNSGISSFDYDFIIKSIEDAEERKEIKAIVIDINSPGGAPVASDEIGQLIKNSNKSTVAWIREIGTSGAYWIATNADYIIANRMSITGSIGVIGSYLEFSDFLTRYNITYQRVVSAEQKDMGSPFKKLSSSDEALLQTKINKIHEYFVQEVAENRELSKDFVEELATGIIYLGSEAKDLGLVDELGSKKEVKNYLEEQINEKPVFAYYKKDVGLLDLFSIKSSSPLQKLNLPEGVLDNQGIQLR